MCDAFFHLNFLNARGFLAQKICDVHVSFCQLSGVKNGGHSQEPCFLGQFITGEHQRSRISCPKES